MLIIFSHLKFNFDQEYKPSQRDILHANDPTTCSILEYTAEVPNPARSIRFVECCGHPLTPYNQLHKWLRHDLKDFDTILFFVNSCDFDSFKEDGVTSRLQDAIDTCQIIINQWGSKPVPVTICINKMDLLEEKIREGTINIKDMFPEFDGHPGKIQDVQEFIGSMFNAKGIHECLYYCCPYYMTAIDTEHTKMVFRVIYDGIRQIPLIDILLNKYSKK